MPYILSIDGHVILGNGWHFSTEHFITVDEVSEKGNIWVDEVERFMEDEIGIEGDPWVESVVLQMGRVQMLTIIFVAPIFSDDSFEVIHREEVGVIVSGCLESNWEARV